MDVKDIEDIYSLTPMQECMLFSEIKDKDGDAYFQQLSFNIKGNLYVDEFIEAYNTLVKEYDILRTRIIYENISSPKALVVKEAKANINYIELLENSTEKRNEILSDLKIKDRKKKFNIQSENLSRITIIKWDENDYSVIWSFHHIIIDGWSMPLLTSRLFELYKQLLNKETIVVKENKFKDYVDYLNRKNKDNSLSYWNEYLKDYNNEISLPNSMIYKKDGYKLNEEIVEFNENETKLIKDIARKANATISTFTDLIWGIVLSKYSDKNDVVFGRVVSGRNVNVRGIHEKAGLFINTVPLRIKYNDETNFISLLTEVQDNIISQEEHEFLALPDIQALTSPKENLISNIIAFENYPIQELSINDQKNQLEINNIMGYEHTNYNFNLIASSDNKLKIKIVYNSNNYDSASISRIADHIRNTVLCIIKNENTLIKDIDIISQNEYDILNSFNDTLYDFDDKKLLFQYLEETTLKYPDKVAIKYKDISLTYKELDEKSNALAWALREKGIKPNDIVAVKMFKCIEMIISIYGILKAGAAYLPIDPSLPKERIDYMISNSKSKLILEQEDFTDGTIYSDNNNKLNVVNTTNDLAYIIYTSGSTGNPKGVMIHHKAIVNRLIWMQKELKLNINDVILQKTVFTFDVSVWEIFLWSFVGCSVILLESGKEKNPDEIINVIYNEKITTIHFVPSMLRMYIDQLNDVNKKNDSLKYVITSGEELMSNDVSKFYELQDKIGRSKLINLYGPTECAVDVTCYNTSKNDIPQLIPIGKAIDNIKLYVLDNELNKLPIGVVGELYIGGVGVAKGYINNEELTNKVFIDNPYVKGEKIYKTGDLAKYLNNGDILYKGRIDFQVKIRGLRIEIGEIENCLNSIKEIINSCVVVKEYSDGDKILEAFVEKSLDISEDYIFNVLKNKLPIYMVPSKIIFVDRIPLNNNNKIDRKAVLKLNDNNEIVSTKRELSESEAAIKSIWCDILEVSDVDVDKDFFSIGGHSLKAVKLASRLSKLFKVNISIEDVFKYNTISSIANRIENINNEPTVTDTIVKEEKEKYSLSPTQKGIYITSVMKPSNLSYNMPSLYKLSGQLDINKLNIALSKLIKRHESLRTHFENNEGEITQVIDEAYDIKVKEVEFNFKIDENELIKLLTKPFELDKAPLFRLYLINCPDNDTYMFFDMHHIISDGVSTGIFIKDLIDFYNNKDIEPLEYQFKDYAEYINKQNKKINDFWIDKLNNLPELLDFNSSSNDKLESKGNTVYTYYNENTVSSMLETAKSFNITLYMYLLGVYSLALARVTDSKAFSVGTGSSGRDRIEFEKVIGPFVNSLFINIDVTNRSIENYFMNIKQDMIDLFKNCSYTINELSNYYKTELKGNNSQLINNMFILQNMEIPDLKIGDVTASIIDTSYAVPNLDLSVYGRVNEGKLKLQWIFDENKISKEKVDELISNMKEINELIINNRDIELEKIIYKEKEAFDDVDFDFL